MKSKIRIGLRYKVIILCTLLALILCGGEGYIDYNSYSDTLLQKYEDYAGTLIRIMEKKFNESGVVDLLPQGVMDENYERLRGEMNALKESAEADYLYAVYFKEKGDIDSLSYVINGVAGARDGDKRYDYLGEPCKADEFGQEARERFLACIESRDTKIHYYASTTPEYGSQLTCYKAVYGKGDAALLLAVDISMDDIDSSHFAYVWDAGIRTLVLLIVLLVAFIGVTNHSVVKPILRIEQSSRDFVEQMKRVSEPDELDFKKIPPFSTVEIDMLRGSIEVMAESIRSYMTDLERVVQEKGKITAELDVATDIQLSMLPRIFPPFPQRDDFDLYASIETAREVGGDFYDFYMIDDTHLCVTMADVSGKGVPAALFMVIAKTLLKNHMLMGKGPAQAFADVNSLLAESNEQAMFVTAWLAVVDLTDWKMTVVNAGHNPPLLGRADGGFTYCYVDAGFVLAAMEGVSYQETQIQLFQGDVLYLYTDGITEANNAQEELYGEERLQSCLNRCGGDDPKTLIESVKADIAAFVGEAPQFDDMTMLALKIIGGKTLPDEA